MQSKNTNNIMPSQQAENFLALLMANQRKIYGLILTLVPNRNDADDIMQEATITMWRKYETFEEGTNFSAWAAQIARYMVMGYYRKHKDNINKFSQQAYEKILEISEEIIETNDDRMRALQGCIAKLKPDDSNLLNLRYNENKSIKQIADDLDRPLGGLYKVMTRIHTTLRDCVNNTMSAWEMPQ